MTQRQSSKTTTDDAGFGVYVHWPFCAQKCPYCDFNSHVRFQGWDEARFLAAYKRELDAFAAHLPTQTVSSIFFGGGTPSLMQGATVAAILDHIAKLWPVASTAEITLEANPGSVEADRFRDYKTAGVNRVSIGVQSLIEADLKALGRIHTVAEAKTAVALAHKIFDRFSFDLIYARPDQTPEAWKQELIDALAIAGGHLSLYQLTIEEGTPFAERHKRGQLKVPDEDKALHLFEITQLLTADAGLPAYEISNHAAPGHESQHNLIYWRYGSYAGVGPGAHGRVSWDGQRHATATERNPEAWRAAVERDGHGLVQRQPLSDDEQADEFLLMGLRLTEGINLARYNQICGRHLSDSVLRDLIADGFLERVRGAPSRYGPLAPRPHSDLEGDDATMFGGLVKACVGPGLGSGQAMQSVGQSLQNPASERDAPNRPHDPVTRVRATAKGRFVLNQIVYQLASTTELAHRRAESDVQAGSIQTT